MAFDKIKRREKIKRRIRKDVSGTSDCPRMSVYRSNKQISVQLIDDVKGVTLASATSLSKDILVQAKDKTKTEQAALVGKAIAEIALKSGISTVVFDRNGYLYHGRVKTLADAARSGGLQF
jgi:large subunit ribosomal protein L18